MKYKRSLERGKAPAVVQQPLDYFGHEKKEKQEREGEFKSGNQEREKIKRGKAPAAVPQPLDYVGHGKKGKQERGKRFRGTEVQRFRGVEVKT